MLTQENLNKVEEIRKRYPTAQAALLPVLWIAHEQEGWISEETMRYVGGLLGLPLAHILGVVTFYTMFNTKKIGKYHIQVCTNISCQLLGSETIMEYVSKKTGCKKGETSPDGLFTLSEVECLGSCGTAPMMQVNDDYYEDLTFDKIDAIIASMK
ncbi:MAG: NAD(P)H-dependent oxidoreductase subunit E [Bacteroidota bacterium]